MSQAHTYTDEDRKAFQEQLLLRRAKIDADRYDTMRSNINIGVDPLQGRSLLSEPQQKHLSALVERIGKGETHPDGLNPSQWIEAECKTLQGKPETRHTPAKTAHAKAPAPKDTTHRPETGHTPTLGSQRWTTSTHAQDRREKNPGNIRAGKPHKHADKLLTPAQTTLLGAWKQLRAAYSGGKIAAAYNAARYTHEGGSISDNFTLNSVASLTTNLEAGSKRGLHYFLTDIANNPEPFFESLPGTPPPGLKETLVAAIRNMQQDLKNRGR